MIRYRKMYSVDSCVTCQMEIRNKELEERGKVNLINKSKELYSIVFVKMKNINLYMKD